MITLDDHRNKLLAAIEHYRRGWGAKEVSMRHRPVVDMVDELYEVIRVLRNEPEAGQSKVLTPRPTVKHNSCEHECQQAKDYGVWPEASCSPVCVYLSDAGQLQDGQKFDKGGLTPIADEEL